MLARRAALALASPSASAVLALAGDGRSCSTRLGAEFVPQLDEGDLLIEARRLPGHLALATRSRPALRLERRVAEDPRGRRTSSARTGSPEVATDPMGIEQSDVYVELKPRDRRGGRGSPRADSPRRSPSGSESDVPEIAGAVSQPIQMRTNELVAGVRSDVAVIVYGRDLERAARSSASRSPTVAARRPGRRRRARRAGRGPPVPPHRSRPRTSSRATASPSPTSTSSPRPSPSATRSARCSRASVASSSWCKLAHGFAGDLEPLRGAAAAVARAARSCRSATSPTLAFVDGPGAGQPREAVAPHHRRVQRPRARPAVRRRRGAGRDRARRAAPASATASSGAGSSSTTSTRRRDSRSSCRSRSR